jgi:potassium/hydrogen antiporter
VVVAHVKVSSGCRWSAADHTDCHSWDPNSSSLPGSRTGVPIEFIRPGGRRAALVARSSPTGGRPIDAEPLLLIAGCLLFVAVGSAYAANRVSVPILVAFLGIGMLLGSDGPGGVDFDNAELARDVGIVGLAIILFDGGLSAEWRHIRSVLAPAVSLGTIGVFITAGIAAAAAYLLFDLSVEASLLLGAVVGSTDAAAVFSTLRTTGLRRRPAVTLEAESGVNDPMAVALTLGLISVITKPDYGVVDFTLLLLQQFGIGLAVGVAVGWMASRVFARFPQELAPFAPVFVLACGAVGFGAAGVLDGSGFLAVYITGLMLGDTYSPLRRQVLNFHAGLAFLAQIALFIVLGLLVFPSQLDGVIIPGLALAAVLTLVARPVAVFLSTLGMGFSLEERALLGWAGLRGAVPIVLATFPLSEGIEESSTIFNAVFFVVLISVVVQGLTLPRVTRALGLVETAPAGREQPLEAGVVEGMGGEIIEHVTQPGDAILGRRVSELRLPPRAMIAVIVRDGEVVPPRGNTRIEPADRLFVLARAEDLGAAEQAVEAWRGGDPASAQR